MIKIYLSFNDILFKGGMIVEFKKKEKYLLSIEEFREIKRNPFIAGILSVFLGILGIHRFYTKRYLTGFIFLISTIASLEMGEAMLAVIIMMLTFFEGIVYIVKGFISLKYKYIEVKNKKTKKIQGIVNENITNSKDNTTDMISYESSNRKLEPEEYIENNIEKDLVEKKVITNGSVKNITSNVDKLSVKEASKEISFSEKKENKILDTNGTDKRESIGKNLVSSTISDKNVDSTLSKNKLVVSEDREEPYKVRCITENHEKHTDLEEKKTIEKHDTEVTIIQKNKGLIEDNWIEKLSIPYERKVMRVAQVKKETLKFYEKLCNFIDEELKKIGSSLNKEKNKISEKNGPYNNILYTFYCISEGHVTKVYNGNNIYYDPDYSYRILEKNMGKNIREKVYTLSNELEKGLPLASSDTKKFFHREENEFEAKIWDIDGSLRKDIEFSDFEIYILDRMPLRNTVVWNFESVKKQIIIVYLDIWKIISEGLESNIKWKNKSKRELKSIKNQINNRYYFNNEFSKFLSSLVKLSENAVRSIMPNTQVLDTSREKKIIKEYLPQKIVEEIENKIIEFKEKIDDEAMEKILLEMINKEQGNVNIKVKYILMQDLSRQISILNKYNKSDELLDILKGIVNETDDESLLLVSLYGINAREKLSNKNNQLLKKLIHPGNKLRYNEILNSKEKLSPELLKKLIELREPIRKKIELDMKKVELSKKELSETVEIVKDFIGDKEESQSEETLKTLEETLEEEIIEVENELDLKIKHKEFIKEIIAGSMSVDKANKIAMDNGSLLNSFISDVNKELYEYIEDQAIIVEDDYIKIDDFYIDLVKELV